MSEKIPENFPESSLPPCPEKYLADGHEGCHCTDLNCRMFDGRSSSSPCGSFSRGKLGHSHVEKLCSQYCWCLRVLDLLQLWIQVKMKAVSRWLTRLNYISYSYSSPDPSQAPQSLMAQWPSLQEEPSRSKWQQWMDFKAPEPMSQSTTEEAILETPTTL